MARSFGIPLASLRRCREHSMLVEDCQQVGHSRVADLAPLLPLAARRSATAGRESGAVLRLCLLGDCGFGRWLVGLLLRTLFRLDLLLLLAPDPLALSFQTLGLGGFVLTDPSGDDGGEVVGGLAHGKLR